MNISKESRDDRLAEEAAHWFNLMREEELSGADRQRFARWLAESPVHVREYLGVSTTWGALHSAQHWPEQTSEQLLEEIRAAQASKVVPLVSAQRSVRSRVRFLGIAAGMVLAVLAAAMVWLGGERDVYRTARGEQRSVVLADGSVVQLNTLTKMIVRFDEGRRRIELPRGEAFFRVAHDAARPFDVQTPYAVVRAVGTEFNVYNRAEGTQVVVVEGKVAVTSQARSPALDDNASTQTTQRDDSKVVAAGERVTVAAGGAVERAEKTNADAQLATAWMQRRIVLDNDRIDTAVAEFNRYNKLQMQVDDADLAGLRISGAFSADDPRALMKYLEQIHDVEIRGQSDEFVLARAASSGANENSGVSNTPGPSHIQ